MKRRLQLYAALLTVCILLCSLSSCWALPLLRMIPPEDSEPETIPVLENPVPQPPDELEYTLTQSDLDDFRALLTRCREIFVNGSGATEAEMEDILDSLDDAYYHIATQSSLAYIYYCIEQESETASSDYLFASSAQSDLYREYIEFCREVDAAESSPEKEFFFCDWTEEDFAAMREYDPEISELSKANDELLVNYRALSDKDFKNGAAQYYVQLIRNNNRIAKLNGYENYWQYAYREVYHREYDAQQVNRLRTLVQNSYWRLCEDTVKAFSARYSKLDSTQQALLNELWKTDYDTLKKNYVRDYVATYDSESAVVMNSLFDPANSFFTKRSSSYAGAFTGYLYEFGRPVCYFGPGYQGSFTVIHEMGHYFAESVNETSHIAMDLAETQSQGNEWIFSAYLNGVLQPETAEVNVLYQLYSALTSVILGVIVDDFEQRCYEMENVTVDLINKIIEDVMNDYGGKDWLSYYVADVDMYWRYVALESPVYYISYSVSMLAALQLYCKAERSSYQTAQECYLSVVMPEDPEADFLTVLRSAGLNSPFETSTYQLIRSIAS